MRDIKGEGEKRLWWVQGIYGNYFAYITVDKEVRAATADEAIARVLRLVRRKHPYMPRNSRWIKGPECGTVSSANWKKSESL